MKKLNDKKDKSIVEIFTDTFLEYVGKDIQALLDLLPDDLDSKGDDDDI